MTAEDPSGRVGPRRRRWVERDFLKLWAGQTVSELGSSITLLALPTAAVIGFHANAFQVGLLAATSRVPFPFLSLLAGVVVDRLPRRPILIVCDVGRCLVLASIPLAAMLNLLSLPQLFVTAFASGVLTVFFDVAYLSYVPVLAGRDELIDANARLQLGGSFAQVAGPGLAGLLVQLLGAARAIAADAGSFLTLRSRCCGFVDVKTTPTCGVGAVSLGSWSTACGSSRPIASCAPRS